MPDRGPSAMAVGQPLHAILISFPVALFPAGLAADITYLNSGVIQWTNFAQWLIAGAEFFTGLTIAWVLVSLFLARGQPVRGPVGVYLALLALLFVLGLVNSFHHAKDAWASVGTAGLILSLASTVIVLVAAVLAHSPVIGGRVRT